MVCFDESTRFGSVGVEGIEMGADVLERGERLEGKKWSVSLSEQHSVVTERVHGCLVHRGMRDIGR